MTQHFIKTLIIFTGMIVVGLIGVFLVSYFGEGGEGSATLKSNTSNIKVAE